MGKADNEKKDERCKEECHEKADVSAEDTDEEKSHSEEELTKQLEQLEKESKEHLALAQRVQADFDNFRRRKKNISAEYYDVGVGEIALEFLSVLDNLERAAHSMHKGDCPESFVEGIDMVIKQFNSVLAKFEIAEIEALDRPFDPELHHAVAQVEAEEGQEKNTVVEVLQKGYKHKDKVLRYSMVKVSK